MGEEISGWLYLLSDLRDRMSALLQDLLVKPQDFTEHIKRCNSSAAAIAVYGQRAASNTDFWSKVRLPWQPRDPRLY